MKPSKEKIAWQLRCSTVTIKSSWRKTLAYRHALSTAHCTLNNALHYPLHATKVQMYKWSCGSSALEEKALMWSSVQMFLVMHWSFGCSHLGAKHNKRQFPFSFIPFTANHIKQRAGDRQVQQDQLCGCRRQLDPRVALCAAGLHRPSLARHGMEGMCSSPEA